MRAPVDDMSAMVPRSRRPAMSISTGIRERQRGAAISSMNLSGDASAGASAPLTALRRVLLRIDGAARLRATRLVAFRALRRAVGLRLGGAFRAPLRPVRFDFFR